jgi:hypothetical protein
MQRVAQRLRQHDNEIDNEWIWMAISINISQLRDADREMGNFYSQSPDAAISTLVPYPIT